jgi:hypothetical protein
MTLVHDEARAARLQAARALVGGLLAGHPEARSLLSEASHWRGLAEHSDAVAATVGRAADLARLRHEELRHRLDPRGRRRGRYGVACALVAAIGGALAGLARIELARWADVAAPPAAHLAVWLVAMTVAAVWLAGAWLAATSGRTRRALLAAAAVALATLPAALAVADGGGSRLGGTLSAVLCALLAIIAAALIARTEPAALARTRRHWRHAARHRDTAAATARADASTAAVTRESWLGLVRTTAAEEDEQLAREAIAVAAGMI